jgi:hypothetical protein
MPFKNFSIWRRRLPHWRADDVIYYVTFRHRRPLDAEECRALLAHLLRPDARRYDVLVAAVLPEQSELMFTMQEDGSGRPHELATVIEGAKRRAGKEIVKRTGERFPPFYEESYDRIVRDEGEFAQRWNEIIGSPERAGLGADGEWPGLYRRGDEGASEEEG